MPRRYILIVGAAVVLVAGWLLMSSEVSRAEAQAFVELCGQEPDESSCYEREVSQLFPEYALPDIFEIIREIRRLDPSYQYCHVLAHKVGESAVAHDPEEWLNLIPMNPSDGLCSNGFIHGLIVGRFRDDVLTEEKLEGAIPDFARACEARANWRPSGLDQGICYHGLGHLYMFITNADIEKALDVCMRTAASPSGNFMRVCVEGVFMQIYQPLEPDDFLLIDLLPEKPTRENYRRMCAHYGAAHAENEGACLREAWPLFREEIMRGDIEEFCAGQPNAAETEKCYESSTTIIGRQSLGGDAGTAACAALSPDRQALCYTTVAQAILEEDRSQGEKALNFCARASEGATAQCYSTLATRAYWLFGADTVNHERFCALLPAEYRTRCGR